MNIFFFILILFPFIFDFSELVSNQEEFPSVIDFSKFKLFQDHLKFDDMNSETWKLANSAFELGYIAFNDSPEIGTFIHMLKNDYQIEAAVETGTFLGSTAVFFSLCFDEVHTIEASTTYFTQAKDRLKKQKNIQCHYGSSDKVLRNLLPTLQDKRLLFYLDAHTYYLEAEQGGYHYWPILEELEEISKTHKDNCIIVIDDFKVPNTNIHGCLDLNGENELSHELIYTHLQKNFTGYDFHYLIPKNVSRAAKFVAIPKKWRNPMYSGRVDILSGFSIYDFPIRLKNVKEAGFDIQMLYKYPYPYEGNLSPYDPELKKIIVFGWTLDQEILSKLPKEKLLFFIMEPCEMPLGYYDNYPIVYTCNDDLVDGIKFFKLNYPYLMPMSIDLPAFEQKKLCVMVSGSDNEYPERKNELYSQRMKMVEFFETKPEGEFDIYGRFWVKRHYRDFRGSIPGDYVGEEKISTLKKYRFCICFENTKELNGYITEKIFGCFAAGCVPIYWGPTNIESYIPKQCFIDYRDFKDNEELYKFIKTMTKEQYNQYLDNIRHYLNSEQAKVFSPAHFEKTFLEAIMR